MRAALSWLQPQPDAEVPPARGWRDWLLVAAVGVSTTVEVAVRQQPAPRLVALAFGLAMVLALLWRRTQPLAAVALGFGALIVVDVASVVAAHRPFYPYAGALVVVLVFWLFRRAPGRQAAAGSAIVLLEWVVSTSTDFTGVTDALGGIAVLSLAAALGVTTRYRHVVRTQQLEQVRSREREVLARELHDTVAHHVSAIAVQAQAGQVLAASSDLPGATQALATIEEEAARTLAEMRSIVGYLRAGGGRPTRRGPQAGVADIDALAGAAGPAGPRVVVERRGGLDDLPPAVQAALYRVAQESVTNARRHARRATRVHVQLSGEAENVRLRVSDDGEPGAATPRPPGYGLVGMAERVTLLGGSLEAGPRRDRGWTVEATIPRHPVPA